LHLDAFACFHLHSSIEGRRVVSVRRLALTALTMALIGVALSRLTPSFPAMAGALASAQRTADTSGADSLVLAAGGLLAWSAWTWGAAGLCLTALSALPGVAGCAARSLARVVLPAGARRGAALLLGVGLGVAAPVLGPAAAAAPADHRAVATVPDWPVAPSTAPASAVVAGAVPDWPAGSATADPRAPTGAHVVLRGECLWDVAAGWLHQRSGTAPTDAEIAAAVRAWWSVNAGVIGADPDLLLPGQVLSPPP
jgi:hypothetical protein